MMHLKEMCIVAIYIYMYIYLRIDYLSGFLLMFVVIKRFSVWALNFQANCMLYIYIISLEMFHRFGNVFNMLNVCGENLIRLHFNCMVCFHVELIITICEIWCRPIVILFWKYYNNILSLGWLKMLRHVSRVSFINYIM